jgi:hypothetical protein
MSCYDIGNPQYNSIDCQNERNGTSNSLGSSGTASLTISIIISVILLDIILGTISYVAFNREDPHSYQTLSSKIVLVLTGVGILLKPIGYYTKNSTIDFTSNFLLIISIFIILVLCMVYTEQHKVKYKG